MQKWILKLDEGKFSEPNDRNAEIEIFPELLIQRTDQPIALIIQSTYSGLLDNYLNINFLKARGILVSTIETVDEINEYVLGLVPSGGKVYVISNSVDKSDVSNPSTYEVITTKFLNSLRTQGLPNQIIKLKVGTLIMLLRNLDQTGWFYNGTRLIVIKFVDHILEAKMMFGTHDRNVIYILRITTSPSQSPWPFKLSRRKFMNISYAMTINKSKDQSLDFVELYLPYYVFIRGQLYVEVSRLATPSSTSTSTVTGLSATASTSIGV
ncbi:uncharacterized protein LOC131654113 [Vicia villosa]|uniref:uncharacterized protein LOC131654113 n=1 Tax=Vicia villosa TaxID=3911 RepID=UPI00273B8A7B|nr:uncharacterized protein LOC131654113 [Vicia villosa]